MKPPTPTALAADLAALTVLTTELRSTITATEVHRRIRLHLTTALYHLDTANALTAEIAATVPPQPVDAA